VNVNFGLRTLLLFLSAAVFVLAVFDEGQWRNLIAWGLAGFAFSFLITDIGWDRRYGSPRR
jgi:predicted cobalt transporter CbtA